MKTLTLALDDDLYALLNEQAATTGRTINDIATEALDTWILTSLFDDEEIALLDAALREPEQNDDTEP